MSLRGRHPRPDVTHSHKLLASGGRLDSATNPAPGVLLIGGRAPNAGKLWKSVDYGDSFALKQTFTGTDPSITTLAHDGAGRCYAVTSGGYLWTCPDYGDTWTQGVQVSNTASPESIAKTYGLVVTALGTVIVTDTTNTGGHIFRSTNQGASFSDLGAFSTRGLYRVIAVGDGLLAIGWAGKVYKSTNDGLTWSLVATLSAAALFAIEYLGNGVVLIGDENGVIYRSADNGANWITVGTLDGAADDFAAIGNNMVLYHTYTSRKLVYFSDNGGLAWREVGTVATGVDDNQDHLIPMTMANGEIVAIGGTVQGFIKKYRPLVPAIA